MHPVDLLTVFRAVKPTLGRHTFVPIFVRFSDRHNQALQVAVDPLGNVVVGAVGPSGLQRVPLKYLFRGVLA